MSEPTATASNSMELEEEVYVPRGNISKVIRIVGEWTFNCSTDTCAICRVNLTSPSINYQDSSPGSVKRKDSCKIAFQDCGHPYHYDCIAGWHKQHPNNCPLCSRTTQIIRLEPVHGYEAEI